MSDPIFVCRPDNLSLCGSAVGIKPTVQLVSQSRSWKNTYRLKRAGARFYPVFPDLWACGKSTAISSVA
jgi:hypothetical protein